MAAWLPLRVPWGRLGPLLRCPPWCADLCTCLHGPSLLPFCCFHAWLFHALQFSAERTLPQRGPPDCHKNTHPLSSLTAHPPPACYLPGTITVCHCLLGHEFLAWSVCPAGLSALCRWGHLGLALGSVPSAQRSRCPMTRWTVITLV